MGRFDESRRLIGNRPWVVTAGSGKNKEVYLSENWDEVDPADKRILDEMDVEYHREDEQGRSVFTAEKSVAQYRYDEINYTHIEHKKIEKEFKRMPENWPILLKIPLNIGVLIAKVFLLLFGYIMVGLAIAGSFARIIIKILIIMMVIAGIPVIFGAFGVAPQPRDFQLMYIGVFAVVVAIYFLPNLLAKIGNYFVDLGTCLVFF